MDRQIKGIIKNPCALHVWMLMKLLMLGGYLILKIIQGFGSLKILESKNH
jgi:hypothetical protein